MSSKKEAVLGILALIIVSGIVACFRTGFLRQQKYAPKFKEWVSDFENNKLDIMGDMKVQSYVTDAIRSIAITSVEDDEYTIEVKFVPYKQIQTLDLNEENFNNIKEKYYLNGMSDEEFKQALDLYCETEFIENCLRKDTKVSSIFFRLHYNQETGVTYDDQKNLINELLKVTNILENTRIYEYNIQFKIKEFL